MKNILFVSHDASRTGAPIVLLKFLQRLTTTKRYNFSILIKYGGGILTNDFKSIAPTYQAETNYNLLNKVKKKTFKLFFKKRSDKTINLDTKLKNQKFDLIYLNTVLSLDLAYLLKLHFNCPIITHIHENEFAIKLLFPNGIDEKDIESVKKFIAVSESTKNNLIDKCNIQAEKVVLIYPFASINEKRKITIPEQELKSQLVLKDSFIVGGCGDCNWRKGVDLFIQLAVVFNKLRPGNDIKLMWVGRLTHEFTCQIDYELKRLGVEDKIIFTGTKPDPQNYFQLFDVFALTSREDPFPLVALEAAAMEKPVIFFEQAGGMSELFINNKGGIKTAFADVTDMANAILFLIDNTKERLQKGKEAASLIKKYDINVVCEQLIETIEGVIK